MELVTATLPLPPPLSGLSTADAITKITQAIRAIPTVEHVRARCQDDTLAIAIFLSSEAGQPHIATMEALRRQLECPPWPVTPAS